MDGLLPHPPDAQVQILGVHFSDLLPSHIQIVEVQFPEHALQRNIEVLLSAHFFVEFSSLLKGGPFDGIQHVVVKLALGFLVGSEFELGGQALFLRPFLLLFSLHRLFRRLITELLWLVLLGHL